VVLRAQGRRHQLRGSIAFDLGGERSPGPGQQHWSTVHAADLADFFRRVLEIRQEWASEDLTAILNDTGTYKAPWIP
jgi:hypothetical protein